MWPTPEVMSLSGNSVEKVTLKTSCENALLLQVIISFAQSQMASVKSGSPLREARSEESELMKSNWTKKSIKTINSCLNLFKLSTRNQEKCKLIIII